jgi:hypothetical protein
MARVFEGAALGREKECRHRSADVAESDARTWLSLYLSAGVSAVWIVDAQQQTWRRLEPLALWAIEHLSDWV